MFDDHFGMTEEEYEAELVIIAEQSDDPSAKRWLKLRNSPPLTNKQIEKILIEMSAYNSDAPAMLRAFQEKHKDELSKDEAAT